MDNCHYTKEELENIYHINLLADQYGQYNYDNELYYKCNKNNKQYDENETANLILNPTNIDNDEDLPPNNPLIYTQYENIDNLQYEDIDNSQYNERYNDEEDDKKVAMWIFIGIVIFFVVGAIIIAVTKWIVGAAVGLTGLRLITRRFGL